MSEGRKEFAGVRRNCKEMSFTGISNCGFQASEDKRIRDIRNMNGSNTGKETRKIKLLLALIGSIFQVRFVNF